MNFLLVTLFRSRWKERKERNKKKEKITFFFSYPKNPNLFLFTIVHRKRARKSVGNVQCPIVEVVVGRR